MNRHKLASVLVLLVVGVIGATVALAGGHLPTQFLVSELADPPGWTSEVDFDGETVVWIEVGPGRSRPRPVSLAVRRLDTAQIERIALDNSGLPDDNEDLSWLVGGPRIAGQRVVYATRSGERSRLHLVDLARGTVSELLDTTSEIRDVALHDTLVVWSDDRGGDLDLWSMDLSTGAITPIVEAGEDQWSPEVSDDWLVWLTGQPSGSFQQVMVRDRASGTESMLNPRARTRAIALHGARLAVLNKPLIERAFHLELHDLAAEERGRIETIPLNAGFELGGLDLSERWLIRSQGVVDDDLRARIGAALAGQPQGNGWLIGYDAEAVTSFNNLGDYLDGTYLAQTSSLTVRPRVAAALAVWAEPDDDAPEHEDDRRVMRLLLADGLIYLPFAETDGGGG